MPVRSVAPEDSGAYCFLYPGLRVSWTIWRVLPTMTVDKLVNLLLREVDRVCGQLYTFQLARLNQAVYCCLADAELGSGFRGSY